MARKKQKWLEVEVLKDGTPNILTSFRRIKEMNLKRQREAGEGKNPRRQYACVYCGRVYSNGYKLIGHLKHCDKRKKFKESTEEGIDYFVGNKIFKIKTRRVKVLKNAESYERAFGEKINSGTMTPGEAERLFFAFLQGAESTCSKGLIQYNIRSASNVQEQKTAKTPKTDHITHAHDSNARVEEIEDTTRAGDIKEKEKEEEISPLIPPLSPSTPLYPPIIPLSPPPPYNYPIRIAIIRCRPMVRL